MPSNDVGGLGCLFAFAFELARLAVAMRAPPPSLGRTVLALAGLVAMPLPANTSSSPSGAPRRGLGLQRFMLPHLACKVQVGTVLEAEHTAKDHVVKVSAPSASSRAARPPASPGDWRQVISKNSMRRLRKERDYGWGVGPVLVQTAAHKRHGSTPQSPPETFDAYEKKGKECASVIEMIDLIGKDPDKESFEAETDEKDAQEDYEAMLADARDRVIDSSTSNQSFDIELNGAKSGCKVAKGQAGKA